MGVPAFYRWLVEKYPRCVGDVVEETPVTVNGVCIPVDTSKPNPNGVEFDNLYLDMNGIIHPCFHPVGMPAPKTYDDVFKGVFKYIDRIFAMIRPRKLLYMAIDGVAPTAKMNQQRARRFRAAKEAEEESSKGDSLTGDDIMGGEKVTNLDSNIITPGTEFMDILSSALRYYIHLKMNSDPGWRGIKVILSDANVPGEGEHKIMSYIRLQRTLPGYDPNARHCLYGLDADLIMLALATHEVHFSILREDHQKEAQKRKSSKGGNYFSHLNHEGTMASQGEEYIMHFEYYISRQKFQFLNIWVLREYLGFELSIPDPKVQVNLEQLIDDFVFMCLFVGNDFLPHVPSLEISEGAIDMLIMVYKAEFIRMGGYLTKSSKVYLSRVEHFVQAIGAYEEKIFKKRNAEQKKSNRKLQRRSATKFCKSTDLVHSEALLSVDKVKLGEDGWKERYYCEKFEAQGGDVCERIKRNAVMKYVEGMHWVMHYYYQGVCSWSWFYPYHYAPFASDFQGLKQLQVDFLLGKPLRPFDQLMAVLPASSAQALPLSYGKLMTDPTSPILDFYPSDFELDMNGKRHAWQAVCKLPFIEHLRLLSEIEKVEHTLTDDEKRRNRFGLDQLFLHSSHVLAAKILEFSKLNRNNSKARLLELKKKIEPELSDGMNGYIFISDKPICPVEIFSPIDGMELIENNRVISTFYGLPKFHPHIPRLSEGVILPKQSVRKRDVELSTILWHEKSGFNSSRISHRHIPQQAISGSCLKKLAHQLVISQNVLVKQNGSNTDGYRRNDSEVRRIEKDCLSEQKFRCVDGHCESKSGIRKRKGVPDKTENKKKRRKKNKNNTYNNHAKGIDEGKSQIKNEGGDKPCKIEKDSTNNADLGTKNNYEYRIREQNCQTDQNDYDMDGESEKKAQVGQREQIITVEEKDSNVDGSGKNKSKMRGNIHEEEIKENREENRNNPDKGTEVYSEERTGEQKCQVDRKDFSVDRESEISFTGEQKEQNFIVERKDNDADSNNEKFSELVVDRKDQYAADIGAGRKARKRVRNRQRKQKDNNLNGIGLNNMYQIKKEGDITDKGVENDSVQRKREENCHVNQEEACISDPREKEENFIMPEKLSNEEEEEDIDKTSQVRRNESEILSVDGNRELNENTVDGEGERSPKTQKRERDTVDGSLARKKKKTMNNVSANISQVETTEQNCREGDPKEEKIEHIPEVL